MKRQIISILTAAAVSLTLLGVSAGVSAQAAEVSNASQSVENPITINSVSADYYDFDHPSQFPGQAKLGDTINFSIDASGGVGNLSYRYHITKNAPGETYDSGLLTSSDFTWQPSIATSYNVTVYITDEAGNSVSTSFLYLITK